MITLTIFALAQNDTDECAKVLNDTEKDLISLAQFLPFELKLHKLLCTPDPHKYIKAPNMMNYTIPHFGNKFLEYNYQISHFIYRKLPYLVSTDFCMHVQPDGHIVNPHVGMTELENFFKYDYIGAPWPLWLSFIFMKFNINNRVGSDGFSMYSRRWLEACKIGPAYDGTTIDLFVARNRKYFESVGCKIAPVDVALKFSYEHRLEDYPDWNPEHSFGHHGFALNGKRFFELSYREAIIDAYKQGQRRRSK